MINWLQDLLSLATFLGHAFAAIPLRRSHGIGLHRARHNRSRTQQEGQQRDPNLAAIFMAL
jgi:hypothetical protein